MYRQADSFKAKPIQRVQLTDLCSVTGGRTAWSSRVIVHGKTVEARYWYDGKNLNNAREDAAECAVTWLGVASTNSTSQSWNSW